MERNINLDEISDGKRYGLSDLVKVGCNDCEGCSACCKGMGTSIVLDPLDIYRITTNLDVTFETLLTSKIELNVVDGLILPNMKMCNEMEQCSFLNEEGRCSIHSFRPGICRIFPLGRIYENNHFEYILQVNECKKENKTKVKVQKWIDTPDLKENETYIIKWHYFVKKIQKFLMNSTNEAVSKQLNMFVLQHFFLSRYSAECSFYEQFELRLKQADQIFESLNGSLEL